MKHKHRIVPGHMGGTYDPDNVIELSPEDHGWAHILLYFAHSKIEDRIAGRGLLKLANKADILAEYNKYQKESGMHAGTKNPNYGRKHTAEARLKISSSRSGATYIVTDPCGNEHTVEHIYLWAKERGLHGGNLNSVAKGKVKQHKGYTARFLEPQS